MTKITLYFVGRVYWMVLSTQPWVVNNYKKEILAYNKGCTFCIDLMDNFVVSSFLIWITFFLIRYRHAGNSPITASASKYYECEGTKMKPTPQNNWAWTAQWSSLNHTTVHPKYEQKRNQNIIALILQYFYRIGNRTAVCSLENNFLCNDKEYCVRSTVVCDGITDCVDGSDETNCWYSTKRS